MCPHDNTVEHEGSEVCFDCGYVFPGSMVFGMEEKNAHLQKVRLSSPELVLRNEILDVLAVIHQESDYITEQVISFLKNHLHEPPSWKSQLQRGMVAFAIWEVLNRNDCPHSPRDIAYLCHIEPAVLLRAEKLFGITPTFCPPTMYVPRVCSTLHLPIQIQNMISRIVATFEDYFTHRPEVIIGACVLALQDQHEFLQPKFTTKTIARHLDIAPATLLKLRNTLPQETIEQIIIECGDISPNYTPEKNILEIEDQKPPTAKYVNPDEHITKIFASMM